MRRFHSLRFVGSAAAILCVLHLVAASHSAIFTVAAASLHESTIAAGDWTRLVQGPTRAGDEVTAGQRGTAHVDSRGESPCYAETGKSAVPKVLLLGETTEVTLQLAAVCAGETSPIHIVLVLDASGSMQGQPTSQMKDAATWLVRELELDEHPETLIGVVQFNDRARRLTALTNSEGRVISAIMAVQAAGNTAIDLGIQEGLKVLVQGRTQIKTGNEPHEVMIVLSDGVNNAGCPPVLDAARNTKAQRVLVATICLGPNCDSQCMRQAASSPRHHYSAQSAGQLYGVLDEIRRELLEIVLKRLTISDVLPDNMRYVAGSAEPAPSLVSPAGDVVEWRLNSIPADGITLTLTVAPTQVGFWPTNVQAVGTFLDSKDREGTVSFPVPWVTVLRPEALPTPTEPGVPPTATPSPTVTETPTRPPTLTPTPEPEPLPIYLPIAVWHPCVERPLYSDIALVLDLSTSMSWPTSLGRPKIEATLEAAEYFVGLLSLAGAGSERGNQVAVVGFNRDAWIEQSLSPDETAVLAALQRLGDRQAEFTRLDLALASGAEALRGARRRPENQAVLILLTDGLPNQVPYADDGTMQTTVLQQAAIAKSEDAALYAIGLGLSDHVGTELLERVASSPDKFYLEPDAEDLRSVYSQIVGTLGCPRDRFGWPGSWPLATGVGHSEG